MQKIVIIGSGGSGKSTLSLQLAKILNLPLYHLDALYWKPNWVRTSNDEWADLLQQLCRNERWIIDGSYTRYQSRCKIQQAVR